MAVHRYTFTDVVGLTEAAVAPPSDPRAKRSHDLFVHGDALGGGKWYAENLTGGAVTLKKLVEMVNEGWDFGAKRLSDAIEKLTPPAPINVRRRPRWMDSGDELHIDRALRGDWDRAWRRVPKSDVGASKRQVTVVTDAYATASLDSETMFWRGAAAVALADALTQAGYSVQMVSAFRGRSRETVVMRVVVKTFHGLFDLPTAAASMALPGFFRGLGHAWGYAKLPFGQQIGSAGWYQDALAESDVSDLAEGGVLFVAHQQITDATLAQMWVEKAINDLQGESGNIGTE